MIKNKLLLILGLILSFILISPNYLLANEKKNKTFDKNEVVDKAKIYFADLSEGVGIIIERSFNDFGQPTAYIEGEEFSGAFFG